MSHDCELISIPRSREAEEEAESSRGSEMEEGEDKAPLLDEVGLETPSQMISKEVDPVCRDIGGAVLLN